MSSDRNAADPRKQRDGSDALVAELRRLGVRLGVEGGQLVCRAPRGVIGPDLQAAIAAQKPGILEALAAEAAGAAGDDIPRVARTAALPLGFVQQRMWLHAVMEPDTVLYHLPAAWRLRGPLDRAALGRAFADVAARHEILRSRIDAGAGEPSQHIEAELPFVLPFEDLTPLPEATRAAALMARLATARDQPFDLEAVPLFRALLVRMAADDHVLFFMPHHVIWDGWSFDVFLGELSELYGAHAGGAPARLPDLPIQYVDYAVWHRRWLQGGEIQRQCRYWEGHLAGELPVLEMPADKVRPRVFTYRGDWEEFWLDGALVSALAGLGKRHQASFFMVMLAAWYVLLHRHTGQDDVVVGVPIQARERPEVAGLIGAFVNTLVLRARLDGRMPFCRFLEEVKHLCLDGYEHQQAPFEMLMDRLVKARTPDRTPLFQAMFSHQQVSRRPQRFGPLGLDQVHVNPSACPTDIMLAIMEGSEGARGVLHYSTDVFEAATVRLLWERLHTLLGGILEDPEARVADLPVLTATERRDVLVDRNHTAAGYDRAALVQTAFGRAAASRPQATAVECGGVRLTYGELDKAANRLARHLREQGAGPGGVVGLYLERSTDLVVGLLAVLRSGAAYLPLDPSFPRERLAYMLSDSGARLVVTAGALAGAMPAFDHVVVDLDKARAAILALPADPPDPAGGPEDVAYLIYTSGSTGRPKGVQVPHRAVVNFLESTARTPGCGPGDRLLAVTTTSFDISVLEVFLPLSVGGCVVVATQDEVSDGHALVGRLRSADITMMQATPATWRLMVETGWTGSPGLRALCGGEGLPAALAAEILPRVGELWNMYGPTETTVWSTCARVTDPGRITIGGPLANTQVYVLGAHGEPVPPGVAGELYIGGDGLAVGYLGQPELTASRFVPDPFSARPGARLYRTGDRVRWLAGGELEHLGRLDHQVKVRGYRIELGEIETILHQHGGVREAVVVTRDFAPGDTRLVAYVAAAEGQERDVRGLRRRIRDVLPDYMVPASFVWLPELPRTPNGKIDRKALPSPDAVHAEAPKSPPRSEMERLMARAWGDLLGVSAVGVTDNFFDLGGHSLLALAVAQRVHAEAGVRMHPRELIFQTLEQVSASCEERRAAARPAMEEVAPGRGRGALAGLKRALLGDRGGRRTS